MKAFLKAGILTELGDYENSYAGKPQGGILSLLLANIALSVLDEHLHEPWKPGGPMSTRYRSPTATAGGGRSPRTRSKCLTPQQYRSPRTATGAARSPTPGLCSLNQPTADAREPVAWKTRTAGLASGLGKRTRSNPDTAPQVDSTIRLRGLAVAGNDAAGRKSPHNHAQTARNLKRSLRNAAAGARLIQAEGLDSKSAADIATSLADALKELHRLRRNLDRRIRHDEGGGERLPS